MKKRKAIKIIYILLVLSFAFTASGCGKTTDNSSEVEPLTQQASSETAESQMDESEDVSLRIGVGIGVDGPVFNATLYDTDTSDYLISQIRGETMLLPLSYDQEGVAKYYDMPQKAPEHAEQVESVRAGEILLDGGDRLIVYYQNTEVNGSYTKVGQIEDPAGFAQAVGTEDIQFFMYKEAVELDG